MINKYKLIWQLFLLLIGLTLLSCHQKTEKVLKEKAEKTITFPNESLSDSVKDSISGSYISKAEDCAISLIISKDKKDYKYIFATQNRTLKGKAVFSKNSSGEKYISLEGIQWDEYEGDISNEDDSNSDNSKDLEIPIGIDALYVKDTLTIQNYGNAMNSYIKISECGLKYIQLIKANSKK